MGKSNSETTAELPEEKPPEGLSEAGKMLWRTMHQVLKPGESTTDGLPISRKGITNNAE